MYNAHGSITARFILDLKMDSVYTQYTDQLTDHVAFTINNSTDQDQRVYLQDLTAYGFKNNIDYITNAFTWIEERDARSWYADIAGMGASDLEHVYVLCCLRLEPNNYATIQAVVDAINEKLMSTVSVGENTFRRLPCGLYAIQLMREQGIGEYKHIRFMLYPYDGVYSVNGSEATPTVRIAPAVLKDQLNMIVPPQDVPLPVNINANMPICVTIDGSDISLNEEEVDAYITASTAMRKSVHSLTRHAINCDKGITKKLGLNVMTIDNSALFYTTEDAVRLYENGDDYTEFLLNNSMLDMLTLRSYLVNTKVFKGFDDNTEIADVTTGIDKEGTLWSLNVNSSSLRDGAGGDAGNNSCVLTPRHSNSPAVTDLLELHLIRPTAIKMSNIQLVPSIEANGEDTGEYNEENKEKEDRVNQVLLMLPHFTLMANQVGEPTSNTYNGTYVLRSKERFEFTFTLPNCDDCEGNSLHSHKGNDITYTVSFNDGRELTDVTGHISYATILGIYATNRLVSYNPANSIYDDTNRVLSAFPEVLNNGVINYLEVKSDIDEGYVSSYAYLLTGTMGDGIADNTLTINNIAGIPGDYLLETSGIRDILSDVCSSTFMLDISEDNIQEINIAGGSKTVYGTSLLVSDCHVIQTSESRTINMTPKQTTYAVTDVAGDNISSFSVGRCEFTYRLRSEYRKQWSIQCILDPTRERSFTIDDDNIYHTCNLTIVAMTTTSDDTTWLDAETLVPIGVVWKGSVESSIPEATCALSDSDLNEIPFESFGDMYNLLAPLTSDSDSSEDANFTYDHVTINIHVSTGSVLINASDGTVVARKHEGPATASCEVVEFDSVMLRQPSTFRAPNTHLQVRTMLLRIPIRITYATENQSYVLDAVDKYITQWTRQRFTNELISMLSCLKGIILEDNTSIDDAFISNIIDSIAAKFEFNDSEITYTNILQRDLTAYISATTTDANTISFTLSQSAFDAYPYLSYLNNSPTFTFQHSLVSWYYYRYLQRPNNRRIITPRAITQRDSTTTTPTTAQSDTVGGINYAQSINDTNIGMLNPLVSLPFFPYSDKLYVKLSGISDIDYFIETNSNHETVRGKTLSIIPLSNTYVRVLDTYDVTNNNYTDSAGVVTQTVVPTTISGSSTLTGNTDVQTITQSLNTIIDVPAGESRTIYVTGNLHTYPIYKAPHRLTYEIL